jgi:putative transposase
MERSRPRCEGRHEHFWCRRLVSERIEQVKRLKELELENNRLRKVGLDLTLDKLILQEAARGNF